MRHNIRRIRNKTGNGFCAVVKADAYGHGLVCAPGIEPVVDCFMVATASEAYALSAICRKPILTLGGDIYPYVTRFDSKIIPTVCNTAQLGDVVRAGYKRFSIAVNTGMNRLGADENELNRMVAMCKELDLPPWSVFSHVYNGMYSAGEQALEFDRLTSDKIFKNKHLYCSCALDLNGFNLYDMIRCGIAMYGYGKDLDVCMRVRAKIVELRRVARGQYIGYGEHALDHDAVIATVSMGYADGLRRCDKQLYLRVRDVKCPIVGVPCMDMCMIDVTKAPCRVGEFAYLIKEKSDAEFLAKCYNTIVYEVLTGFNGRAERIIT